MHWAYPERFVWLLAVPALGAFWIWALAARRRDLAQVAQPPLLAHLVEHLDARRRRVKIWLTVAAVACAALALLGPQWGFHWETLIRRGVDVVVALDVSKSMLAEDVKPSRLERAKLALKELAGLLAGDRIGLVTFAGTSFIECPLTVDYDAFSMIVDDVSVDSIPRGGTSIGRAIRAARQAFEAGAQGSRVILLITDGEDHEGDALAEARETAHDGIVLLCVGIGTTEGELIPVTDGEGHQRFLKDTQGRTVKSRIDERLLEQLAAETGGAYVHATSTSFGLDALYRQRIATLDRGTGESTIRKQYEHRFQWPLAIAWLLLAIEPLIGERRRIRQPQRPRRAAPIVAPAPATEAVTS